jgi:hypothetical protein
MFGKQHSEKTKELIKNSNKDKTIHIFKNTLTEEFYTGTQYDFRVKYNLLQGNVSALIRGVQKSLKGWILV